MSRSDGPAGRLPRTAERLRRAALLVAPQEFGSERGEGAGEDAGANAFHQVDDEMQVVDRREPRAEQLARGEEVAQVAAAEARAGVARAAGLGRLVVEGVARG